MKVNFHSNREGWKWDVTDFLVFGWFTKVSHYLPLKLTFHPDWLITIFVSEAKRSWIMQWQLDRLYKSPKLCNILVFSPLFMFNLKTTIKTVPFSVTLKSLSLTLKCVKTSNPGLFCFSPGYESLAMSEQMGQSEWKQYRFPQGQLYIPRIFASI